MSVGFLINLLLSSSKGEWNIHFHLSLASWISIIFLGIFCSGLAYFFWYSALEKKDSSLVGIYLYLEPFVTLIGAYFLLGERIQWVTLVGGGLTVRGTSHAEDLKTTHTP
jgi:drug/metabolite transporter (DMT)-like permease